MKYSFAVAALLGNMSVKAVQLRNQEYPQPDIRGPMPVNAHPDSTFSSFTHNDWTQLQTDAYIATKQREYPQPDIRGPMPVNAHPDSTFSSFTHNDWTQLQTGEYPQPDIRGPMPVNAHPDSTFSSFTHNDWTQLQAKAQNMEYPQPDIRGPMPVNAHPDTTFSSHVHNDWTQVQAKAQNMEYPQPDIRGPMPVNAHPDTTFSSHVHNDWTQVQAKAQNMEYPQPDIRGPLPVNAHPDTTFSSHLHNDWTQVQAKAQNMEYPQPDIRGPMPVNAHPDSTFSSFTHNDWTQLQTGKQGPSGGNGSVGSNPVVVETEAIVVPEIPKAKIADANKDKEDAAKALAESKEEAGAEAEHERVEALPKEKKVPSKAEKKGLGLMNALMVQIDSNTEMDQIDAFTPFNNGQDAQDGYDRETPERFSGERDDSLMRSLINNYAIELKSDGNPSGHFYLDQAGAKAVAEEVLRTHGDITNTPGAFMTEHFSSTWEHFDVNHDAIVEVERMPQFLRYFTGNALDIDLQ